MKFADKRNQIISRCLNQLDLSHINVVYMEPLRGTIYTQNGQKMYKKPKILERWIYNRIKKTLEKRCQENGVLLLTTPNFLQDPPRYDQKVSEIPRDYENRRFYKFYENKEKDSWSFNHMWFYPEYVKFRNKVDPTFQLWAEDDKPLLLNELDEDELNHKKLTLKDKLDIMNHDPFIPKPVQKRIKKVKKPKSVIDKEYPYQLGNVQFKTKASYEEAKRQELINTLLEQGKQDEVDKMIMNYSGYYGKRI
jgi:hypothetical protein